MIVFWTLAALLSAGAAALVLRGAAAGGRAGVDPTLAVYRRAMTEIDDLADRELIPESERRATKAEAGRRLIDAAETPAEAWRARSWKSLIPVAACAPVGAILIYLAIGSPGMADQPFAGRLARWRAHPERFQAPELAAALRAMAGERPRDPEPLRRLAGLDLSLGDADGAIHALRKADVIAPGTGDFLSELGEVMVLKARGQVSADAQAIFREVLRRDPRSPSARYYLGRAAIAAGDRAQGQDAWRRLLSDLAPDDPRRAMLAGDIAAVDASGGLASPGALAPTDQARMSSAIRGMVDGLAARLAAHPEDGEGWVRLVRAYTVLGEREKRDAALVEARRRFADRPAILSRLSAAAQGPG